MRFTETDNTPSYEWDGPVCFWCSGPIVELDDHEPYCCSLCAAHAAMDSLEDSANER